MPRAVFVSYSQPDRECAYEIVSRLEGCNIGAWIAPRDISPSADWAAEIIDAISCARVMVLVFSSHSNVSPQVRREVERAVHKQVPILPFRIESIMPSRSLEYFLSAQHWLDAFPGPLEPYYTRLCDHLAILLNAAVPAIGTQHDSPPSLTGTELQLLESQLAYHVGPIARHLVKRAAARTTDWGQLTSQLAREVDSEPARRQFLDACRTSIRPGG
jgi:hypothetical protein